MQPEAPVPSVNDAPKGLPPVAPPSGKFIIQLFLIPGLIVAVAVLIVLGFQFLVGGTRSPQAFLKDLDSPNPDVRWRAASELAQVLMRPESLEMASDPRFGLDLAERLQTALEDVRKEEESVNKKIKGQSPAEREATLETLAPRRRYARFLAACLGNMTIPVGADVLCAAAVDDAGSDLKSIALRRRGAVWALANLGENLKRYQKLSEEQQEDVIAGLEREAAGKGSRAKWARSTLAYLKDKKPLGVDHALAQCARDRKDPYLRELTAFALKYWDGPEVEPALEALARDQGEGQKIDVGEVD